MKGISPIVAAVLLIGITMVLSVFLAIWSMGFLQTKLEEEKAKEKESALCASVAIRADECNIMGNDIYIRVFNYGKIKVENVTAQVQNLTYSGDRQFLGPLFPGESKVLKVNKDAENFDKIIISAVISTGECPQFSLEIKGCKK